MTSLDLDFVRAQFPAFTEPSLAGFAHFENAGGSFACRQMIAALESFYRQTKVQPYYGFEPSATAGARMDSAQERLAAWLNVARGRTASRTRRRRRTLTCWRRRSGGTCGPATR